MAEPILTEAATSAIATRTDAPPSGRDFATESWSRSRESSLSMEAQGRSRRSRMEGSDPGVGPAMALASAIAAGEKSGSRPRSIMARRAMLLSSLWDVGRLLGLIAGIRSTNPTRQGVGLPRSGRRARGGPGCGAGRGASPGPRDSLHRALDLVDHLSRRLLVLSHRLVELTLPLQLGVAGQGPGGLLHASLQFVRLASSHVDIPLLQLLLLSRGRDLGLLLALVLGVRLGLVRGVLRRLRCLGPAVS